MFNTEDENLICPFCGSTFTHIDEVSAGCRREDGDVRPATLNGISGKLVIGPQTELRYSSRRHWFEIHIDCENCDGGNLVLAQHKGQTQVRLVPNVITSVRQVTDRVKNDN